MQKALYRSFSGNHSVHAKHLDKGLKACTSAIALGLGVLLTSANCAGAATLSDVSAITTGVGNGFNGANTSAIATNSTTFGFADNSVGANTFRLANPFTLTSASTISAVTVYSYSTSTYPFPPVSPFTGISLNIWDAAPGTAGASVLFSSTTLASTAWTGIYRVTSTTLTNAQRPVFSVTAGFNNQALSAGTFWADWAITALVAPGAAGSVFNPQLTNANGTQPLGVARQFTGGAWVDLLDNTGAGPQVGLPLTVEGTVVPEPASFAGLLALGGVGVWAKFRRKRKSSEVEA